LLRQETLLDSLPPVSREPGALLQALTQRAQRFRSLRSLANVHYAGSEGRTNFQEAVFVRRPEDLRLETLSRLGAVLIVTANGEEVAGYHPQERLFFRGPSIKENVRRYVRIPLELSEITALLMGLPPLDGAGAWVEEGESLLRDLEGGLRETITFHPSGVPVRWERSEAGGEILLSARFYHFTQTPAGTFPSAIALRAHREGKTLEIRYEEPEVNVALPADLFVQDKPQDVRELPIGSLGG
jgi:hypothetical protein